MEKKSSLLIDMHGQNASYMAYFEVLFEILPYTFYFFEQPHFKQLGPILSKN